MTQNLFIFFWYITQTFHLELKQKSGRYMYEQAKNGLSRRHPYGPKYS